MGSRPLFVPLCLTSRIDFVLPRGGCRHGYSLKGWDEPCSERVLCFSSRQSRSVGPERICWSCGRTSLRCLARESTPHRKSCSPSQKSTWNGRVRTRDANGEDAISHSHT